MAYEVRYSVESIVDLKRIRKFDRTEVLDQIQRTLSAAPTSESRSRIKKLRQPAPAEYRLRIGDHRVFYDVAGKNVNVLRVLSKRDALQYLGSE